MPSEVPYSRTLKARLIYLRGRGSGHVGQREQHGQWPDRLSITRLVGSCYEVIVQRVDFCQQVISYGLRNERGTREC